MPWINSKYYYEEWEIEDITNYGRIIGGNSKYRRWENWDYGMARKYLRNHRIKFSPKSACEFLNSVISYKTATMMVDKALRKRY